jgi:hypothetical protein
MKKKAYMSNDEDEEYRAKMKSSRLAFKEA